MIAAQLLAYYFTELKDDQVKKVRQGAGEPHCVPRFLLHETPWEGEFRKMLEKIVLRKIHRGF